MKNITLIACLLAIVCMTSCSRKPIVDGEVEQMIWDTSGGGQIRFTVSPDNNNFKIQLESFDFKEQKLDLVLAPDDGNVYDVTKAIFSKERDIRDDTFVPGGSTGTWTSITLVGKDGESIEVKNIDGDDIWKIKGFVAAAANKKLDAADSQSEIPQGNSRVNENNSEPANSKNHEPRFEWETTGGGDIGFAITQKENELTIHVSRHQGTELDFDLPLATDSESYATIKSIFRNPESFKVEDPKIDPATPQPLTGTWTNLNFIKANGESVKIGRSDEMHSLYMMVADVAKEHMPQLSDDEMLPPEMPVEENESRDKPLGISKMIWKTTGGGQIEFSIVPQDDQFNIRLGSYSFVKQDSDLVLTAEDKEIYDVVKNIFSEDRDLNDDTFTPGGPTGTWTSITLINSDGKANEINNISSQGDLGLIYSFVKSSAKPQKEDTDAGPMPPPTPNPEDKDDKTTD